MDAISILRGFGKVIGSIIFTTALALLIFSIGIVEFTEYENMNSVFAEILGPQLQDMTAQSQINAEDAYRLVLLMCQGEETIELPITEGGDTLPIDCNDIRSIEGEGSAGFEQMLTDVAVTIFFESIYYAEYDCGFLDCINQGDYQVVMSSMGHEFFIGIQQTLSIMAATGAVLILVCTTGWPSRLKAIGWPMMLVGVSYFIMTFMKDFMISKLSPNLQTQITQAGMDMTPIIEKIIQPMKTNLLLAFVVGVTLTAAGFGIGYYMKTRVKGQSRKSSSSSERQ